MLSSGTDDRILNPVLETRMSAETADADIDAILESFRRAGHAFIWWRMPHAEPADLGDRLTRAGLAASGGDWPGMAVELAELDPVPTLTEIELRRVTNETELAAYIEVFAPILSPSRGFTERFRLVSAAVLSDPDPAVVNYVAWRSGTPIGTASLVVAGGAAGIYNVTTAEEARRRGIGAALTLQALHEGRRRGLTHGVLQASELGLGVYERIGFREYCTFTPYVQVSA